MPAAAGGGPPTVLGPGLLLGAGLGGFVDGIVLHQVLQWHHMLTGTPDDALGLPAYRPDTVDGLEVNTLWDGVFHAATWVAVVVGLALLWRRVAASTGPWSRRSLTGCLLAGWGLFNLVEGVVNHHVLGLHHVRDIPPTGSVLLWDVGFLGLGAALVAAGSALYRRGRRRAATRPAA